MSFEEKYGTIPEDDPGCPHPKHLDIIYHFAIGEPMSSTYTWKKYTSMSAAEMEVMLGCSNKLAAHLLIELIL